MRHLPLLSGVLKLVTSAVGALIVGVSAYVVYRFFDEDELDGNPRCAPASRLSSDSDALPSGCRPVDATSTVPDASTSAAPDSSSRGSQLVLLDAYRTYMCPPSQSAAVEAARFDAFRNAFASFNGYPQVHNGNS